MAPGHPGSEPVIRVVRGDPTPDELAAVVTVLTARVAQAARSSAALGGAGASAPASRSAWSDRSRLMRGTFTAGPGAWKRSALPG